MRLLSVLFLSCCSLKLSEGQDEYDDTYENMDDVSPQLSPSEFCRLRYVDAAVTIYNQAFLFVGSKILVYENAEPVYIPPNKILEFSQCFRDSQLLLGGMIDAAVLGRTGFVYLFYGDNYCACPVANFPESCADELNGCRTHGGNRLSMIRGSPIRLRGPINMAMRMGHHFFLFKGSKYWKIKAMYFWSGDFFERGYPRDAYMFGLIGGKNIRHATAALNNRRSKYFFYGDQFIEWFYSKPSTSFLSVANRWNACQGGNDELPINQTTSGIEP